MVKVTFYQNRDQQITGFDCLGHAEYAEGNDIVCAAVSALVINCINSVETFTKDSFQCDTNESDGMISFRFEGRVGDDSLLLLKSLLLGLQEMENNYENYVDVIIEEV